MPAPAAVTREEWLGRLVTAISPWYSGPVPPLRLSVGFTSTGRRSRRIGECWSPECDPDGACHIFIHPGLTDVVDMAGTVVHELVHAVVGVEAKHGPAFKREALRLGLTGKMTATTAGPDLRGRLEKVIADIGPIPHGALRSGARSGPKKQTTRMVKVECESCGYTVRAARKWLEVGAPICPTCETPLAEAV